METAKEGERNVIRTKLLSKADLRQALEEAVRETLDKLGIDPVKASNMDMSLSDALERWIVHAPGQWENATGPRTFWAVANEDGIVAYFADGQSANRYRLMMVALDCNPYCRK